MFRASLASIEVAAKRGDAAPTKSGLQSFVDRLKEAGVVVKETLALAAPLGTLAGLVGSSLAALGV